MAFPPPYRDTVPRSSIAIPMSGADRFRKNDVSFAQSPAMAIPGIDLRSNAPPPLPPPRNPPCGEAPTQRPDFKMERRHPHGPSSSSSMMSGYGSASPSFGDWRPSLIRRDIGSLTSDEGYSSYASSERCRDSLPAEFGLHHNQFQFSAGDQHDECMKKKLNPVRTADKSGPLSLLTSSMSELARLGSPDDRFSHNADGSFKLPIHSRTAFEALPQDPPTFPPQQVPCYRSAAALKAARIHERCDLDSLLQGRLKRLSGDDAYGSESLAEDAEMDETSSLKTLYIEDSHATAGQKRRAASPAFDDLALHGLSGSEMTRRREPGVNRVSPTPHLSVLPRAAGTSARYSVGATGSGAMSPGGLSPTPSTSPYNPPASLNHSPRFATNRGSMHIRNISGACSRKAADVQKPKFQGFFMCECCPKKPKKFETREELCAHEAEKQYECSFCGNRFKNKNEAERHQNSLHVRRHSWSCSALVNYYRAYHESTIRPGQADACGYCGEEFPRSGLSARGGAMGGGMGPRHATQLDWDERIRHLQETHKFRECNSSKKFYRADHFRQHLKHSHAGTSGKWTNMLENACLIEEESTR